MKNNPSTPPSLEEIKIAVDILKRTITVGEPDKAFIIKNEEFMIFVTRLPRNLDKTPNFPPPIKFN